ncbi:hypothetical protein [Azospirillum sp.]|uniref:hypothetical protein n=1 Tax=Azospirillum sp. TaxID=34012 RepID=UPI003D71E74F
MITLLQPLPSGNAVRVFLTPPPGAVYWRLLRRTADAFAGPDDPGAVLVAGQPESTDNVLLDDKALVNGVAYFYRAYAWNGVSWSVSASASVAPAATYQGDDIDPLSIVRDRLAAGLAVEVKRGALKPQSGAIPVLTAPFAAKDKVTFPVVSVHLEDDSPSQRAIGELLFPDEHEDEGGWTETEGWLARTTLNIVAVSLNPDERIALRRALKRIIQANLPVFDAHGLQQVEFTQKDTEDFESQNAPLYMVHGSFVCISSSYVSNSVGEIADVDATLSLYGMEPFSNG